MKNFIQLSLFNHSKHMQQENIPLKPELLILHQGHSKVTEGWNKATIHDIQPYRDSWGDKMMVFFRLDGDEQAKNPLAWICPLIATPRNKTGKFLEALGRRVEDGTTTRACDLVGMTLWLKTTLISHNQIPFYKVTQFNYEPKGGDLFDTRNYPIGQNTGPGESIILTAGPGADGGTDGVDKPARPDKPYKRKRAGRTVHTNRGDEPHPCPECARKGDRTGFCLHRKRNSSRRDQHFGEPSPRKY